MFPLLPLKASTGRTRREFRNAGPFGEIIANELHASAPGAGRVMRRTFSDALVPWLLPIGLLLVWEIAARSGWLSARVLPAPSATALAFWDTLRSGALAHHVWISTERALLGLAIGGSLGFALGLLNGVVPLAERLLDSSLQMLRNIPHLAVIPLVILWFGIGEEAKLFLVAARRPVPDLPQHVPWHPHMWTGP